MLVSNAVDPCLGNGRVPPLRACGWQNAPTLVTSSRTRTREPTIVTERQRSILPPTAPLVTFRPVLLGSFAWWGLLALVVL